MPAIRDHTMNYTAGAATSLQLYSPWDQAGDLLIAVLNNKATVAQTWANTVAVVTGNITATTANIFSFSSGSPLSPMTTISGTGVTSGTQITGQVTSFLPANAVATVSSGGTINTAVFTANSTTNIAVSQLVVGTGVPNSTYVSEVNGNVVTLTQNFTANASGTYNFYLAGATGQYTVSASQTVANTAITATWSTLYSALNNFNGAILYKLSSGNELDPLFSYTTSSTSQGHLIAVKDINPALPFGGATIPQPYNGNVLYGNVYTSSSSLAGYVIANVSSSFTATCAATTMTVTAQTLGTIQPGQQVAGGTGLIAGTKIVNQQAGAANIAWATATVQSGTAIVLSAVNGNVQPGLLVNGSGAISSSYYGTYVRQYWPGNTTVLLSQSVITTAGTVSFSIPGGLGTYTTTTSQTSASAARTSGFNRNVMPQIITANANSMVMYINVDSSTAQAMVVEGPCIYEDASDGAAQSQGFAWTIQSTAGTSPANVFYYKLGTPSTAQGMVTTLNINPPTGGSTVIPAYCASDASYLIDPLTGTSYNQNITPTATALGTFGTTLNGAGFPIANASAVSNTVDVGINSYHSMALMTGLTTNKTWAGVTWSQLSVNRTDVTGKNILLHLKPQTPKAIQNTDSIGRTGVKGLAFGLTSQAGTNYKIYHVHGADTVWNSATYVPVVINTNSTKGLISSSGTLNPANVTAYGLFVSGSVTAPSWNYGSQWLLDTTVVAGGNSIYPVGMSGIAKSTAEGKERLSMILQANGQALILQPLQFGNGGTDPINLNLDCTVIEFPKQYDVPTEQVYYCAPDNIAGITYYAGPSDTIVHTNAVISSFSPFYWRFHPSTSASASYNFAGTRVFGAGNIVLNSNVTLNDVTFTNCVEILTPGGSITNSTFAQTTATTGQGAVKISGSSNVAIQSALTNLANCTFSTNTTGSGALHIVYTGSSTSNTAVLLSTSSLSFLNNNYDIYWEAPVWTPLTIQQTSTTASLAKTWQATNNNTVYLPPIRTLVISNIIDGSNVSIYTQNTPTVAIAGPTNFSVATYNTTSNNLYVGQDLANAGRYTATYSFEYTTARGSTSGVSLYLTIATTLSGTVAVGQTINGTGVASGTVVVSVVGSTVTMNLTANVPAGTYLTFDTPVNVVVLNADYQALRPQTTLVYAGTALSVNQITDRQYTNPT